MKILMSAFACCPGRGSEEGVGWNWAVEAARQGHDVTVLTQVCDREAINAEVERGAVPANLGFEFLMPGWLSVFRKISLKLGLAGLSDHLTHMLWQFAAYAHMRHRATSDEYDLVHHITYGGIRHPTLLGLLPVPLVLGPVGGGDRIPYSLRSGFGWLNWCRELVRDLHTWALRLDPVTRNACANAKVIYTKTDATKSILPRRWRNKAVVRMEVGIPKDRIAHRPRKRPNGRPLRLLYAGRLMDLKGMRLGLLALARAHQAGVDVRLSMAGSGPDAENWKNLAGKLGIDDLVDWRGWVSRTELDRLYQEHDAFLFPSLRDSSGNVVLEALAAGCPVICLSLGGPGHIVNERCGLVVPVEDASELECAERLADAIGKLGTDRELLSEFSSGALDRARDFLWPKVVGEFYADVCRRLGNEPAAKARPVREIMYQ